MQIRDAQYLDRTTALFTLADGREIMVILTGTVESTPEADQTSNTTACIYLEVDDNSLTEMSPEAIRAQLRLSGDRFCWSSHWDDPVIQEEADRLAEMEANEYLDAIPEGLELPSDMPAELKRETVLHYVVKQLLEEAGEIWAPTQPVQTRCSCKSGQMLFRDSALPAQHLKLQNVVLEKRVGKLRPDLLCTAYVDGVRTYDPLFIEVTVTHGIDEWKASRLIEGGFPTLEVDISRLGGRVNRKQLKDLVVQEVEHKRWVFNPLVEAMRVELLQELDREQTALDAEWEKEQAEDAALMSIPVQQIATQYLEAVREYLTLLTFAEKQWGYLEPLQTVDPAATQRAQEAVRGLAVKLAKKGHPEASEETLFGWHGTLAKLLSIQHNRGIGYNVDSGFQVLNACFQANPLRREHAVLCMAAAKVFALPLNDQQQRKVDTWRQQILDSIDRGEDVYGRKNRNDSILALLFPKLRTSIEQTRLEVLRAKRRGRLRPTSDNDLFSLKAGTARHKFSDESGFWLTGDELARWVKDNPDSAAKLGLLHPRKAE